MNIKQAISGLAIVGALGGGSVTYFGTIPVQPRNVILQNEDVSKRTANSISFKTANPHVFNARVYSSPVNYKDKNGKFRSIDTSLQEKAFLNKALSGYEYEVASGVYNAEFPAKDEYNYRFSRGGASIVFQALYDTTSKVKIDVEPNTQGIKETIILKDDTAPQSLSWKLTVEGFVRANDSGGWTVCNAQANDQFYIEPLTTRDSKGTIIPVSSTLINDTLTAVLDCKNAVFPVEVDPTTSVNTNAQGGYEQTNHATYLTARNAATADLATTWGAQNYLGQDAVSGYHTFRIFMNFSIPSMATCSACTLFVYGVIDNSATDFNINIYGANSYRSTFTEADNSNFNGWQASGAYNGTDLNVPFSTSSFVTAAWNSIIFNSSGRDSLLVAEGDSLWIAAISSLDSAATQPAGDENVVIHGTTYKPYLSITYTVPSINAPTNFFMQPITGYKDSLLLTLTKNYSDNIDSLILYQWPDSVRLATLTKTATSIRRGGLNPFTKYRYYVRADSAGVYGYSNPDSCYTLQTFKTENFPFANYGYDTPNGNVAIYDSVRSETLPDSIGNGFTFLGQQKAGADYHVFRHFQNIKLPIMNKVIAETLVVDGDTDYSTTDFNIVVRMGKWVTATATKLKYYLWDGWVAQMGVYTGTPIAGLFSTSSFTTGSNKIPFNLAGRDSIYKWGALGDSLRLILISSKDSSATAPTGDEYVTIDGTASYLKLTYAPPDTIPNSFVLTAISADSLLASWNDRSYTERGFLVYDYDTSAKVAGTDTTLWNVTSLRIGGLQPNKKYRFQVKAVGGGVASTLSGVDSCYTWSAVLGKPTVTMITNATRKFVIDTTGIGNPLTRLAAQDSVTKKFIRYISGAVDTLDATADSSSTDSAIWRTYDLWNGAAGDTFSYPVGHLSALRIWSKSGE